MLLKQQFFFGMLLMAGLTFLGFPIANAADAPDKSGFELNVYGGVADLTTRFSQESYQNEVIPNTLVGSTDSAAFEPGLGIAYDFYTAPYTQISGIGYILNDFSVGIDTYYVRGSRKGNVYYFGRHTNNYNATLSSVQVMLDTQWDFHPIWRVIPFAQVGLGDAINMMSYNEVATSTSLGGQPTPRFSGQTHNNLAYDVGAGIKIPTSQHTQMSLRYLYSDLGNASGISSDLSAPLNVNMHSSSILLGFTYLFGS